MNGLQIGLIDAFNLIPSAFLYVGIVIILANVLLLLVSNPNSRASKPKDFKEVFEKLPIFRGTLRNTCDNLVCLEILVPKESNITGFAVQQKLFKTLHSTYNDPISGNHCFSRYATFRFFQKLTRYVRVSFSKRSFFVLQVVSEHTQKSFRVCVPRKFKERITKSIYDCYVDADIVDIDLDEQVRLISCNDKLYVGNSTTVIRGNWRYRIKTFKDNSADPIEGLLSSISNLKKGEYVYYSVKCSPASHYFNQLQEWLVDRINASKAEPRSSYTLDESRMSALLEKVRQTLTAVEVTVSVFSPREEDVKTRLLDVQSFLFGLEQKNMNHLKHVGASIRPVERFKNTKQLKVLLCGGTLRRTQFWGKFALFNTPYLAGESELYTLWHLPSNNLNAMSVKTNKYKRLPATTGIKNVDNFFVGLGDCDFRSSTGIRVGVASWEDMKRHLYILGGTGSGKSETLKRILSEILMGEVQTSLFVIDPKNDFATDLLSLIPEKRCKDVIYFNPTLQVGRPLGFGFFGDDKSSIDEQMQFNIDLLRHIVTLDGLYSWGPELENILRSILRTAYYLPVQSLSGLDLLLSDDEQIKSILPLLPLKLQKFWQSSILSRTPNELSRYLATTNNKLGKFIDYELFLNVVDRKPTISFEQVLNENKVFIANLGSCSEVLKKYFSSYLANKISQAIFEQAKKPKQERMPCVLVIDEFQRVSSDVFDTLLSEVRAFNASIVIANQYTNQLSKQMQHSIEANVGTKIFMRTQSKDDTDFASNVLGEGITTSDLVNLPTGTCYVKTLVNGVPQEAMSVQIDMVKDNKNTKTEADFAKESSAKYGENLSTILLQREETNNVIYTSSDPVGFEKLLSNNDSKRVEKVRKGSQQWI